MSYNYQTPYLFNKNIYWFKALKTNVLSSLSRFNAAVWCCQTSRDWRVCVQASQQTSWAVLCKKKNRFPPASRSRLTQWQTAPNNRQCRTTDWTYAEVKGQVCFGWRVWTWCVIPTFGHMGAVLPKQRSFVLGVVIVWGDDGRHNKSFLFQFL